MKPILIAWLVGTCIILFTAATSMKLEMTKADGTPAPTVVYLASIILGALLWPFGLLAIPFLIANGTLKLYPKKEDGK